MPKTPIHTIGYGAREINNLLRILQTHQIKYLLDVRSHPYSSYKPAFSQAPLKEALDANGIRYVFMGDALGGKPDDESCYTDSEVDYEKLAEKLFYQNGIKRLHKASEQGQRVVLMCSEGKPENCHRTNLIGKTLTK